MNWLIYSTKTIKMMAATALSMDITRYHCKTYLCFKRIWLFKTDNLLKSLAKVFISHDWLFKLWPAIYHAKRSYDIKQCLCMIFFKWRKVQQWMPIPLSEQGHHVQESVNYLDAWMKAKRSNTLSELTTHLDSNIGRITSNTTEFCGYY